MIYVGKTARYIREKKGMSQREVADALGVTQVHLSNIENNKSYPSPGLLAKYKELWGVDLYILAWCQFGDASKLPESIRASAEKLAEAWKQQLDNVPG